MCLNIIFPVTVTHFLTIRGWKVMRRVETDSIYLPPLASSPVIRENEWVKALSIKEDILRKAPVVYHRIHKDSFSIFLRKKDAEAWRDMMGGRDIATVPVVARGISALAATRDGQPAMLAERIFIDPDENMVCDTTHMPAVEPYELIQDGWVQSPRPSYLSKRAEDLRVWKFSNGFFAGFIWVDRMSYIAHMEKILNS